MTVSDTKFLALETRLATISSVVRTQKRNDSSQELLIRVRLVNLIEQLIRASLFKKPILKVAKLVVCDLEMYPTKDTL